MIFGMGYWWGYGCMNWVGVSRRLLGVGMGCGGWIGEGMKGRGRGRGRRGL
jgi:hypothetical protein